MNSPTARQLNYAANRERYKEYSRQWRKANREKHRAYQLKYSREHAAEYREYFREYAQKNYLKLVERNALRIRKARIATPIWLTDEDAARIKLFYVAAQYLSWRLGVRVEVDHIVPLCGKDVRGLHVPWNLQLLTRAQNRSKSNKVLS